ncbi:hypothetical protein [Microlunatus speluncae]|uniref:hypothetical protein n=1 Tax=Microlunatus speluncae TaxID=2594267 RepID=UPI0013763DA4|nr:hypothetical protein [Microlunatus speluncae]
MSNEPGRVMRKRHFSCPWVKIRHDNLAITTGCIDEARYNAVRRGSKWPPKIRGAK